MVELGELERRHEDFAKRDTRVVVVSVEGQEDAKETQAKFPHLKVVADDERKLSTVADVIDPHSGPDRGDTAAPATILIDRQGIVRWEYRPASFFTRLPSDELLAAIDQHLSAEK